MCEFSANYSVENLKTSNIYEKKLIKLKNIFKNKEVIQKKTSNSLT